MADIYSEHQLFLLTQVALQWSSNQENREQQKS